MDPIVLENKTPEGQTLQATFDPGRGMNMLSYKLGEIEVLDQSTKALFEERYAGLGALIGPHFHHRKLEVIPPIKDESLFPHIARVRAKGVQEPFSHGIGRYAPWKAEASKTKVTARLTGKDTWNGVPLAALEGQNFVMEFQAELKPDGLDLKLSVVSDSDSVVGTHYYYRLPQKGGKVIAQIQNQVILEGKRQPIPSSWNVDNQQRLTWDLKDPSDTTFFPFPNPLGGEILLDALSHQIRIRYQAPSQENSWQLYHPEGASFVCIEPLSAQDPRHPNLTASSLTIHIQILL